MLYQVKVQNEFHQIPASSIKGCLKMSEMVKSCDK